MKKPSLGKITVTKKDSTFLILFYPELIDKKLKNIKKGDDKKW